MTAPSAASASSLDARIHPVRDDLAADWLAGLVDVPRYATARRHTVTAARVPLYAAPDGRRWVSELLFGEIFHVYEVKDEWCWGQAEHDGYVGYAPYKAFQEAPDPLNPKDIWAVAAPSSHVYCEPSEKAPPLMTLSRGSLLTTSCEDEDPFLTLKDGGFVPKAHLRRQDDYPQRDHVALAQEFLGVPYVWGGRSHNGIDCSGLVQISLQSAGRMCPRDTDMIANAFLPVPFEEEEIQSGGGCAYGDLILLPGHVMIAIGDGHVLHANAHHMAVSIEPMSDVQSRLDKDQRKIVAIRRCSGIKD